MNARAIKIAEANSQDILVNCCRGLGRHHIVLSPGAHVTESHFIIQPSRRLKFLYQRAKMLHVW
jgi:hypothetical protein